MQAILTPAALNFEDSTVSAVPSEQLPARKFLETHWELKILFWGLPIVALAYPVMFGITYALAAI